MKIKIADDIYVNSNTLIRIEWKKYLPSLIIHEKFENKVKWTLRIIAIIGIATSLISIDKWYYSLGLTLIIFLIEQFIERAIFEYTTFVIQPFPDFEVDYAQWKTNGFMVPMQKNETDKCYAGPTYKDKEYAIKFFSYLKTWNWGSNIDKENNIILSFIIEPNEKYSTYLYANPGRKNLDKLFKDIAEEKKLEKYGKRQQQFIAQMIYWHTMPFKEGYYIKRFLNFQNPNESFYLIPSVVPNQNSPDAEFLFDHAILKFGYKLKNRNELTTNDMEYHFLPSE